MMMNLVQTFHQEKNKRNTYTFVSVNATHLPLHVPHIHNYMQIHCLLGDYV